MSIRPIQNRKDSLEITQKGIISIYVPQLGLPEELAPGKKVEFSVPYDKAKCDQLLNKSNRVGFEDFFDRIHWVKRRELNTVRKEWQEELKSGKVPQSEGTVNRIH